MKKITAGVVGFLFSSLISSALMAIVGGVRSNGDMVLLAAFLPIYYLISLIVAVFVGGPIFLILYYFKYVNWWSTSLTGLAIGLLVGFALIYPNNIKLYDILPIGIIGAISSLAFLLIWKQAK